MMAETTTIQKLMTAREVAELLVCCEEHVHRLRVAGSLPAVCIGRRRGYRYEPGAVAEFIRQGGTH